MLHLPPCSRKWFWWEMLGPHSPPHGALLSAGFGVRATLSPDPQRKRALNVSILPWCGRTLTKNLLMREISHSSGPRYGQLKFSVPTHWHAKEQYDTSLQVGRRLRETKILWTETARRGHLSQAGCWPWVPGPHMNYSNSPGSYSVFGKLSRAWTGPCLGCVVALPWGLGSLNV